MKKFLLIIPCIGITFSFILPVLSSCFIPFIGKFDVAEIILELILPVISTIVISVVLLLYTKNKPDIPKFIKALLILSIVFTVTGIFQHRDDLFVRPYLLSMEQYFCPLFAFGLCIDYYRKAHTKYIQI